MPRAAKYEVMGYDGSRAGQSLLASHTAHRTHTKHARRVDAMKAARAFAALQPPIERGYGGDPFLMVTSGSGLRVEVWRDSYTPPDSLGRWIPTMGAK